MPASDVEIVSFGYLHAAPPPAHLTIDLREHFRDPHVDPALRYLTAESSEVRAAVLDTPGVWPLVQMTALSVKAFCEGPRGGRVVVADGCAGGRHRAPTFAMALAERLRALGLSVTVTHRDMARPVVQR